MGDSLKSLLLNMAQLGIESNAEITVPEDAPSGRSLRKRSCTSTSSSELALHKTNRRTIQKPRRKSAASTFESDKEVKNFYINVNKGNIKVKPNSLETIFEKEEEEQESSGEASGDKKEMGTRKVKRTLQLCDGLNVTKALLSKRKSQVKKQFGNKKKPKKIALAKFMEYFKDKVAQTDGGTELNE